MGHDIYPERSPPATRTPPAKLSLSDSESDSFSVNSEPSDSESTAGELLTNAQAQKLWESETLAKFGLTCDTIPNDDEFDRLNNKLLISLKIFSTNNMVYCFKCRAMSLLTKRGKTNKTYQFNCGNHTLSATQILGSLPDDFILNHVDKEPRHVYQQVLSWIGKEQLSPELIEKAATRNAVKRFSTQLSPMKPKTSSLVTSRNQVNEVLAELKGMKRLMAEINSELCLVKENSKLLEDSNSQLREQIKSLKEENLLLKKFLDSPQSENLSKKSTTASPASYASVSDIFKPQTKIMKFFTKEKNTPRTPLEIVSAPSVQPRTHPERSNEEFSPLKFVFFKGCHRKSIGEYKKMLPEIGFPAHLARHMCFLTEDILQIVTFESKIENLVTALESISANVKVLKEFDPLKGLSYANYGDFTDESASKCYFALMKQCAKNLEGEITRVPSLKRTFYFIKKVIETKSINFSPAARPTKVFCLGDFVVKKPDLAVDAALDRPDELMNDPTTYDQ